MSIRDKVRLGILILLFGTAGFVLGCYVPRAIRLEVSDNAPACETQKARPPRIEAKLVGDVHP